MMPACFAAAERSGRLVLTEEERAPLVQEVIADADEA